jgi:predicted dehydrogenase
MTVDVGLIGAGNVSNAHLPAFRDREELRLAAVCDADEGRASETAAEFGVDYWTDVEPFVREAPVDAVDVALPHHLHHPAARAALEAGRHVLVEKPFAVSMAECVDLVERAAERDLTLMVGQVQRFDPRNRTVERAVATGELGPIRHARADALQNLRDYADPPHWLYDGARAGGGGVISVAVHAIDLLRYLLGDVARVTAMGRSVDDAFEDAEDYCVALLEFEGGTIADLFDTYSAAATPYGEGFWLFGDDGVIDAFPRGDDDVPRRSTGADRSSFAPMAVERGDLPTGNPFVNELLHFTDCVETGREPLPSGRDNLGTMATVFAIYESAARDGRPVEVADVLAEGRAEAADATDG